MTSIDLLPLETLGMAIKVGVLWVIALSVGPFQQLNSGVKSVLSLSVSHTVPAGAVAASAHHDAAPSFLQADGAAVLLNLPTGTADTAALRT